MLVGDVLRGGFAPCNAGIVDKNVDRPELIGQGGDLCRVRHVHHIAVDRMALVRKRSPPRRDRHRVAVG